MQALILLLPGLGDALTASPILDGMNRAGWDIDALTMLPAVSEYARDLGIFREVIQTPLLTAPKAALFDVVRLRRKHYDVVVLPFPATRWQYFAVAVTAGASRLVSHDYGGVSSKLALVNRATLVQLRGGHRISENARLADTLGVESAYRDRYLMPASWFSNRQTNYVGVHTGSMAYKGNDAKRWPLENFRQLIAHAISNGHPVRVFIGPQEKTHAEELAKAFSPDEIEIVEQPLKQAAVAVSECIALIANDAGFAHVAAGLGVPTITLFGMTDAVRGVPARMGVAVRPSTCPPCHDEGAADFSCVRDINYRCVREDLTVRSVIGALDAVVNKNFMPDPVVVEAPFRLYGTRRNVAIETPTY